MVDGRGGEGREKRKKREKSGNGGVDESVGVGGWVRSGCGVRLWGCMCGGIVRGGDDCGGCEKWFGFVVLTVRKWLGGGGYLGGIGGKWCLGARKQGRLRWLAGRQTMQSRRAATSDSGATPERRRARLPPRHTV